MRLTFAQSYHQSTPHLCISGVHRLECGNRMQEVSVHDLPRYVWLEILEVAQ